MQAILSIQRDHLLPNEYLMAYLEGQKANHQEEVKKLAKTLKYGLRYADNDLQSFILGYYNGRAKYRDYQPKETTRITLEGALETINDDANGKYIMPWCVRSKYIIEAMTPIMLDLYIVGLNDWQKKKVVTLPPNSLLIELENYIQYEIPIQQQDGEYQIGVQEMSEEAKDVTSLIRELESQVELWHTKYEEVRDKYMKLKEEHQGYSPVQDLMIQELRVLHAMVDYLMPMGYKKSKSLGFRGWRYVNTGESELTFTDLRNYNKKYFMRSMLIMDVAIDFHPSDTSDIWYLAFHQNRNDQKWRKNNWGKTTHMYYKKPFWRTDKVPKQLQDKFQREMSYKGQEPGKDSWDTFQAIDLVVDAVVTRQKKGNGEPILIQNCPEYLIDVIPFNMRWGTLEPIVAYWANWGLESEKTPKIEPTASKQVVEKIRVVEKKSTQRHQLSLSRKNPK